ncbi:hypothetical protein Leryth_019376 [Lithospermum erythrorhizon]|nr:hypothetical protein Leryth_019376 [Lithospermum erythrorhizon]
MKQSQTLRTTSPSSMTHLRGTFLYVEAFYVMLVLVWGLFIWAKCESCSMNGLQRGVQYANCGPLKDDSNMDVGNGFSDTRYSSDAVPEQNTDSVCQQGNLFCFRSTLPGFSGTSQKLHVLKSDVELSVGLKNSGVNGSWMMNSGSFNLHGGGSVSCSLSYQDISRSFDVGSSQQHDMPSCMEPTHDRKYDYTGTVKPDGVFPLVEINPTVLDWGEQYLYFPSSASLTIKNTHSDVVLNLYEPYSTSPHFYPCNFSEILLAPGEMALISFIFFPTRLGLSSGQLILQSNAGGFLINAKGFVVESPYSIQPLVLKDISSGKLHENLSLLNPFNDPIFVEELAVWVVVSSGNSSSLTRAICSVDKSKRSSDFSFSNRKIWLNIRSSELDQPILAMSPSQNFEIAPGITETILQVDISHSAEGKVSGAVCMQLFNATDKIGKVMVPVDANWRGSSIPGETVSPVSMSVDVFLRCDPSGTVIASLSVRNDGIYMLNIVKVSVIGGSSKHFNIKYTEGLLLFPGTVTQVALATYTMAAENDEFRDDSADHCRSCKLLIQTNGSSTSDLEIDCEKVAEFCLGHGSFHSIRLHYHMYFRFSKTDRLILCSHEENAVTEAFVHPFERALLGPIVFQPSKRCGWKGSALIRNNLSGVEWLSLQGFGGSLSMSLLEDSEPVQRLEFNLSLPALLNSSSPNNHRTMDRTQSCSHPSLKELYARNTRLPLRLERHVSSMHLMVLVHSCGGFSLEPGESRKLTISYQTDYSAATLYRSELVSDQSAFVIPMERSVPWTFFEVSSSHSGNSTPSSPLSSSSSSTPRPRQLSPDRNQFGQIRNIFSQDEKRIEPNPVPKVSVSGPGSGNFVSSAQVKPTIPKHILGKPVLSTSATFPRAGRPGPDLMSHRPLDILLKVTPHARSPGSKLHDVKSRKDQERMRLEEKFTYDIWGEHLFGMPFTGQSSVSKKRPNAIENNFSSFFVMGPHTLMKNLKQICKFHGNVG